MRVLLVVSSLAPSYGGPAVSVPRLAVELAACGVTLSLWAPDGSALQLGAMARAAGFAVRAGPLASVVAAAQPLDLIHDNGLWWRHNHQLAALAQRRRIPRIVSCRGMLLPWCLRHRRWRKCAAWHLYQRRDLDRAAALHATCAAEAAAAAALVPQVRCSLIANGVDLPAAAPPLAEAAATAGTGAAGVVLFLGRLCPVKGIDLLLQAWARLQPSGWSLRIAGPEEGGWRRRLEALSLALGLGESVCFLGPLDAAARQQQLLAADLLVLPSRSESFAMVVAEALAHGLPVLTTTATPWRHLAEIEAGWLCEPELSSLTRALGQALATPRSRRRVMGARGRRHVAEQLSWRRTAAQFLRLYGSLLGRG